VSQKLRPGSESTIPRSGCPLPRADRARPSEAASHGKCPTGGCGGLLRFKLRIQGPAKLPDDGFEYRFVHETAESFKPTPAILATGLPPLEDAPAASHAPRSSPTAASATSGDFSSTAHWHSDETASAAETPASSAQSDDWLVIHPPGFTFATETPASPASSNDWHVIDPRLREGSDAVQPAVLPH
jgi:hypothetical protein